MKKKSWTPLSVLGMLVMVLFAIICIAPFIYMMIMSFTQSTTLMLHFDEIDFTDFTNYSYVFGKSGFLRALTNSLIVVISSCPGQVTMIPVFIIMRKMGVLNTYFSLVVLILNAFGVFLIRQFMSSVPDELLEAAKVDGCPEYRIFIQIVIPLIKPVLISLVVFTFVSSWNDFLWPLVSTTDSDMYTLTVALSLLKTQYQTNYGLIMAGAAVSFMFPFVLYIFLQKQFVEGIALSGVKG